MLGCGFNPPDSLVVRGLPRIGETLTYELDNPLGTHCPGSTLVVVYFSTATFPSDPCGPTFANMGMGPGPGELLFLPGPSVVLTLQAPPWNGPGQPTDVDLPIPFLVELLGARLYAQGIFVDPSAACGDKFGLTVGADITVGF